MAKTLVFHTRENGSEPLWRIMLITNMVEFCYNLKAVDNDVHSKVLEITNKHEGLLQDSCNIDGLYLALFKFKTKEDADMVVKQCSKLPISVKIYWRPQVKLHGSGESDFKKRKKNGS